MLNKKVLSIILGGGRGTRLEPLTSHRSKPAVPIAGKYRLVDIPISNCLNNDLKRMFVLTQFNSASLNSHVKNTYQFSGFSNAFVDILAAEQTPDNQTWFQGTSDAVKQCQHHFNRIDDWEYALILSGDQLYQMDLMQMVEDHVKSGAEITVATQPVSSKEAPAFGILKTDENSFIKTFTEKPPLEELSGWESEVSEKMKSEGKEYLASMGIYIFNRKVLDEVLSNDAIDFGKEIIPDAITGGRKVYGYQYEGYWEDIGTIKAFYEANLALTDDIPKFNLFDKENTILTRARILPPCKINNTRVSKAMISEGCIVSATSIEHSIIGVRSRIGEGTVIKDAYIMGADNYQTLTEIDTCLKLGKPYIGIGDNCNLSGVIVEKNCRIGNNVTIKGGDHLSDVETDTYVVRDGVIVIKNSAVIAPNTVIG